MTRLAARVAEFVSTGSVYLVTPAGQIHQVSAELYATLPIDVLDRVHVRLTYTSALGVAAAMQRRRMGQA